MSTIIYSSPIFGPVQSRRLGVSLGINLMPNDGKVCTFDCIYCECGFNADHHPSHKRPTRMEVREALVNVLKTRQQNGEPLNDICFAGNGEPTLHPDFPAIISDTIEVRDRFFPEASVSILSNATNTYKKEVRDALLLADNNIQKLDTINSDYISLVDRPTSPSYNVQDIIENMRAFNGHVIIQTMFMRGTFNGVDVDNTSDAYVKPWLDAVKYIAPRQVMIYTIDRETPAHSLMKATPEVLNSIKARVEELGIPCSASE